jgi:CheY-like chemotaxis protein
VRALPVTWHFQDSRPGTGRSRGRRCQQISKPENVRAVFSAESQAPMKILVVDDEESIREITKSTLQAFGYSVMTASDGTEALALYVQNKDEIKVVLTDMMMPYMDGPSTIRALRKMNPNVKVIASSGLTDNGKSFETADLGVKTFLSKPYTAEKLLKALAEILK